MHSRCRRQGLVPSLLLGELRLDGLRAEELGLTLRAPELQGPGSYHDDNTPLGGETMLVGQSVELVL